MRHWKKKPWVDSEVRNWDYIADHLAPDATASDAGKVLTVGETGKPEWGEGGGSGGGETWYKYYVYFAFEPSALFPSIQAGERGDLHAVSIYLNDEISCVWDMNDDRVIIPSSYRIGTFGFCFQGISFDYIDGPSMTVYNMTNTDQPYVEAETLIYTNIPFELETA